MRHSYRPDIPPKPQSYCTQIFDHLGLVAGMFAELGITEVIDQATQQDQERRIVTAGHAVRQVLSGHMGLNSTATDSPTSLVQPTARSLTPRICTSWPSQPSQRWITLGCARNTLYRGAVHGTPCGMSAHMLPRLATRLRAGLLSTTCLHDSTVCPTPHDGKQARPGCWEHRPTTSSTV